MTFKFNETYVQERHMALLFLQNKENCVKKVNDFREEIVMRHDCNLNFVVIFCRIIDGLAKPAVALTEAVIITHCQNVGRNRDLYEIVVFYQVVKFVGLPVLHKLWPQNKNKIKINGENRDRLERI